MNYQYVFFMLSEKMIFKENLVKAISSLFVVLNLFSEIDETFACCKGYFVRGKEYQQRGLILHNIYRKCHGASEMELSDELNWVADKCAKNYARGGTIDHKCPYKKGLKVVPGENLYFSGATDNVNSVYAVDEAIQLFYSEIKDYDFAAGKSKGCGVVGHFTQLVWNKSTELGIGWAQGEKGNAVVALYREFGNMGGAFTKNVFPQKIHLQSLRNLILKMELEELTDGILR